MYKWQTFRLSEQYIYAFVHLTKHFSSNRRIKNQYCSQISWVKLPEGIGLHVQTTHDCIIDNRASSPWGHICKTTTFSLPFWFLLMDVPWYPSSHKSMLSHSLIFLWLEQCSHPRLNVCQGNCMSIHHLIWQCERGLISINTHRQLPSVSLHWTPNRTLHN